MINDEKREIGSEFWLDTTRTLSENNALEYFTFGTDRRFLLSGRTAIDFVLDEILAQDNVSNIYFPSYCCDSMLQPFIDKGIKVEFYDVFYDNGLQYKIDKTKKCDIFFAMNYFGYSITNMGTYIDNFKKRGAIIIEDITHSLLSEQIYCENSDYLIASLRKWFPVITGGLAINVKKSFLSKTKFDEHEKIKSIKKDAMLLKSQYMANDKTIEKDKFLDKYKEANQLLEKEYKKYSIDSESYLTLQTIDIKDIKEKRRKNSKIIHDKLRNLNIDFLISSLNESDTLLFVPILLEEERREKLRAYLIRHEIFCPSHWKKPNIVENNELYKSEISLICDQRYTEKEIEEYIDTVAKFLKEC